MRKSLYLPLIGAALLASAYVLDRTRVREATLEQRCIEALVHPEMKRDSLYGCREPILELLQEYGIE